MAAFCIGYCCKTYSIASRSSSCSATDKWWRVELVIDERLDVLTYLARDVFGRAERTVLFA